MRVLVLLLLLLLAGSAYATVHCATRRFEGAEVAGSHSRQGGVVNVWRNYVLAHLPWAVVPESIQFSYTLREVDGSQTVFNESLGEILRREPSLASELRKRSSLLMFTLPHLYLSPANGSARGTRGCAEGVTDTLSFHWHEDPLTRAFAELPTICAWPERMLFGLDPLSTRAWGTEARSPRDGVVYAPRGGTESMDSVVYNLRVSKAATTPLVINLKSNALPSLKSIDVNSCVDLDETGLTTAVMARLRAIPGFVAGARVAFTRTAAAAETTQHPGGWEIPTVESQGAGGTRLWPTRSCVTEHADGACDVSFGYAHTGTDTIHIKSNDPVSDPTHTLNWFEASERTSTFTLPTAFKPGHTPKSFTVRWLCIGIRAHTFNTVSWSLAGQRLEVPGNAERCKSGAQGPFNEMSVRDRIKAAQEQARESANKVF
jgi:hypothetical protein